MVFVYLMQTMNYRFCLKLERIKLVSAWLVEKKISKDEMSENCKNIYGLHMVIII